MANLRELDGDPPIGQRQFGDVKMDMARHQAV
jgi:hypothetical protein